jgi:hypothetical protein
VILLFVPPHEHLLFDRFRKRLLAMSRRVFRFSTPEKEGESDEDVVKIDRYLSDS